MPPDNQNAKKSQDDSEDGQESVANQVEDTVLESQQAAEDDMATTSTAYRWKLLSTITAMFLIVAFHVLVAAEVTGYAAIERLPGITWAVVVTGYGMALVYSLGADTLRAWKQAKDGGGA